MVAGWSKIVAALLNLAFLGTDTGASGEAAEVLVALLEKDKNVGLLWRRVFTDPAVYRGFYEATKGEGKVTTEAQGRLLGIVARLVERVGWERVVKAGGDPAVEREFMTGTGGLLEYAAAKMVKPDEDVVMHLLLLEFYGALLAAAPAEAWAYLSSLDKAKSIVILAIAPESHTEDELDRGLLQSRASSVLAEVISNIPATLSAPTTPDVTTPLIEDIIGVIKAHLINPYGGPHRPSLTLLHALPEDSIVGQGIVPLLPLSPPQYEFLATLAQLLAHERLFREYASANNQMWELVVKYASSPALGDISELAFDIIEAVSSWGVMEVVKAPGVMLLLANAPERGFGGDVANSVARRRWEVAGKVLERLPEGNGWRKVLDKRVKAGIWGKGGSGAGGEVATMRM